MKRTTFESFGVKLAVEAKNGGIIEKIEERLAFVFGELIEFKELNNVDQQFDLEFDGHDEILVRSVSTEEVHTLDSLDFEKRVESLLRNRIAELAPEHVFIHAGVVALNGQALILPGRSFAGKTTLVRELVRRGAEYYSDDFAVLDSEARVLPFPKPLSVRHSEGAERPVDVRASDLKAEVGKDAVRCGLIFFSEFDAGSKWEPEPVPRAEGLLKLIEHTVPVRTNTEFSLKVLNKLALRAIIAQSYRAEADVVSVKLINYFNRAVIGVPID